MNRKLILGILGIALLVVILPRYFGRGTKPEVTVLAIGRENLSAMIASNGKVEPLEPQIFRAPFDGFVSRVLAVEGRAVKRGELLLEMETAETAAALARAKEELVTAEETLRAARAGGPAAEVAQLERDVRANAAELVRLRGEQQALARLLAKQAATQDELDQKKLELERAEAQARLLQQKKEDLARRVRLDQERAGLLVERAQNEVRSLEEKLRQARPTASAAGTLYALPVRAGDFVHAGAVLAEVADLSRVRVRAFVDEPELGALEPGQQIEITWDAAPGHIWNGRTESVPRAVVSRGTRSVGEVICSVDNSKRELMPNTNVNVLIRVRERQNVVVVPRGAVRVEGNRRVVFVLEGTRLRQREIRVGIASATKFEVLEGLKEGEQVALPEEVILRDGLEVSAIPPK
ncbi:MAG: efflux RND transporter periplasmic adaptor subunit [Acidobacteria bacterium]|nr:efflux RND transporter periplasmic adaptor subunit [Acidobacteriota bacterium]MCL5288420.1 efflux RND transporter periplasmic adaptor subunit [Acidobacteriota bacterium]